MSVIEIWNIVFRNLTLKRVEKRKLSKELPRVKTLIQVQALERFACVLQGTNKPNFETDPIFSIIQAIEDMTPYKVSWSKRI